MSKTTHLKINKLTRIIPLLFLILLLSGCAEGNWKKSTLASFIVEAFDFIMNVLNILIIVISMTYGFIFDLFIGIWTFDFSFPIIKMLIANL